MITECTRAVINNPTKLHRIVLAIIQKAANWPFDAKLTVIQRLKVKTPNPKYNKK